MYNKVISNIEIKNGLKQNNNTEELKTSYACHGYSHSMRVSNYCAEILEGIGASEKEIELGKIAGYLHDVACIKQGKKNHAQRGAKFVEEFLSDINMPSEDIQIIRDAIYYHSEGKVINSNIGAALLIADKIDIAKNRIIRKSDSELYRVITSINEISLDINEREINICYNANEEFSLEKLMIWKKAITLPIKAAKYCDRTCNFIVNNKKQDLNQYL